MSVVDIRLAELRDHAAYVRLFAELGVDDPPVGIDRFEKQLLGRVIVAERAGDVVGYAAFELMVDTGYVRNIVTAPEARQTGVGRALMDWMHARFRAAGVASWRLNVKADNTAAIALYEACGLHVEYRSTVLRLPSDAPIAPVPAGLTLCEVRPDEDAVAEPRFRLLAGQLAGARAKASVLGLRKRGELVGIGAFMPVVPGAFPFRCLEPELGIAFVTLLRPLAPPGKPWIQVTAEGDDALRSSLVSSGLRIALELCHLSAAL